MGATDGSDGRAGRAVERQQELVFLLAGVAAGDRRAFATLYERTSAKLFACVCRILGNQAAAEDAVQEAYFRIWNRAGDFDAGLGSPIAWMATIARHAAIDSARRGAERVSSASTELDVELMERLADPSTDGSRAPESPQLNRAWSSSMPTGAA